MRKLAKVLAPPTLALVFLLGAAWRSELAACVRSVIVNGDFDQDLSGWSAVAGFGLAQWNKTDADGSPNSGSLTLVNNSFPPGQNASISQCGSIVGGASYNLSAKLHPDNFCCVAGQRASPASPSATLHTGNLYVLLNFYPRPACSGTPLDAFVRLDAAGRNFWQSLSKSFQAPAAAASVRTTLGVFKSENGDTLSCTFDDIFLLPSDASAYDPTALCLGKGRFRATAQWTTRDGQTGMGQPVPLTSDTGYFWFFDRNNVELIVKVLNGCGVNSEFWAFAGGLTDVKVVLTITDTLTGAVQTYNNPQGTAFLPIQDTSAFATCSSLSSAGDVSISLSSPAAPSPSPEPSSTAEAVTRDGLLRTLASSEGGSCVPDGITLCLNNSRFAVLTQWTTRDGQTSFGVPVSLTPDTGYFFFFSVNNVEMVVKILNGCGVNSSYWVFAGGLTDVQVVMTVIDTQTGSVRTYANPQGTAFQPIQDTVAFACP